MARYMERVENLARILDVQETFSRAGHAGRDWRAIVELFADPAAFFASHEEASAEAVVAFYLLDTNNPNAILSAVRMARENARTLRPFISTEMWSQLNVFYNRLRGLRPADLALSDLSRLCAEIKESCQTHTGITEGTFYRDQGWYFYQLGKNLERADQTTRLLDVKYHLLLPTPGDVGSAPDLSQWNALLRSLAGYHAFRRVKPSGMSPASVAGFLLFDPSFPRSVSGCVHELERLLQELRSRHRLSLGDAVSATLGELCRELDARTIDDVIQMGIHRFNDGIQMRLNSVSQEIQYAFFGVPRPASAAAARSPARVGA